MRRIRRFWTRALYALGLAAPIVTAVFGVAALGVPQTVQAAAPQTIPYLINFQGRLTDNNGNVESNGSYNIKFRLYTVATGGTNIWEEDHVYGTSDNRVTVTNGLFDIQLGSITTLSTAIFNYYNGGSTQPLYLEVELPTPATATCASNGCATWSEGAMTPRQPLSSSAYAFNSQTLDGQDSSAFGQITASNSWTGLNTFTPTSGVGLVVQAASGSQSLDIKDSSGALQAYFDASGVLNVGQTIQDTTTTVDLGTSANPFRSGYFGTSVQTPALNATTSGGTVTTNAGTIQNTSASGMTIDLKNAANTTLTVKNSGGGVAGVSVTGGLTIGTGQTYNVGASNGEATTCTGSEVLSGVVVTGGVVTGGTCVAAGGGDQLDGTWTSQQATTATGTQTTVQFTGAANSVPSFNNGTHVLTLPANASRLIVTAKGGGGGGGSVFTANVIKEAAGGGEGGTSTSYLTSSLAANYYFNIGGGGAGGLATGTNPGSGGGNTCFGTNSTTACTTPTTEAVGGSGGGGSNAQATVAAGGVGGAGSSGVGDVTITGAPGGNTAAAADTYASGAGGGQGGGASVVAAQAAGNNGASGGGGSGGADEPASATGRAGGTGGAGILSISVYITVAGSGSPATLQTAYNNSTTPDIVLGSSGLTVDNSSGGVSGDLLDVQNNGATINYLAVNTSGISTTGIADSGNFTQSGGGSLSTGSGAVSLNGATTVAAGDDLTLASGAGSIVQNFASAVADSAQSIAATNTNAGAGVTVQGVDITPTNTSSNPSSGTNIVNGEAFEAAGGTLSSSVVTNGIAFNSATGYTNFIDTPTAILNSSGAWTGLTGVTLQSGNVSTPGNIITTGSGTITSAGSISGPTSNTINGVAINAGALSSVTSLTLSGAISGGTTYSGSGNINTTGGAVQTNSTTRIDNLGNLTNIGTISSSFSGTSGAGATNSISNNGASGTNTVNGEKVVVGTGTANATGSNTTNGVNYTAGSAATNNTYVAENYGTGFTNLLTYNGSTILVNGTGQLNGAQLQSGTVANGSLANSSITVNSSGGIAGGFVSLGGNISLAVNYGSTANTAVQGNDTLTCPTTSGNLSGSGNTVTLGTNGNCGAISMTNSPTFSGLVTGNGGLSVTGSTTSTFSGTSGTGDTNSFTNSGATGTNSVIGEALHLAGTSTSGTNNTTGINFGNVTNPGGTNNYYAENFGTGYANLLTYNGSTVIVNGLGQLNVGDLSGTISNGGLTNSSITINNSGGITGGSVSLGSNLSLAVNYGSTAGTAVQGNDTLTCATTSGNLSGGGSAVTLGTNGNCGAISFSATPTFTGQLINGNGAASTPVLNLSGTPYAGGTTSLVQLAGAIASGNANTNGGTYLGMNLPSSGAGSAADFLNFQKANAVELKVDNSGNLTAGGSFTVGTGSVLAFSAAGILQNAALSTSVAYTNLTQVGALTTGSIGSGFGLISTANAISTSSNISTTGTGTISSAGAITGPTTANTINGLVINTGAISSATGYAQSSGNFLQSGAGTFGTGTGAVALNGATTVAANQSLTADGSVLV